jgi:hypothetical protein
MNLFLKILFVLFFSSPQAQAQEHVGHGKYQEQQQQQPNWKMTVIRGEKAEELFNQMAKNQVPGDASKECSEPVLVVRSPGYGTACFDRGENFRSDWTPQPGRYKCYVRVQKLASMVGAILFQLTHNECGGDGIYPVHHRQQ